LHVTPAKSARGVFNNKQSKSFARIALVFKSIHNSVNPSDGRIEKRSDKVLP